jgi:hypothetical protein
MPEAGFQPTIPAFEESKTVFTLNHAATAIGQENLFVILFLSGDKMKDESMLCVTSRLQQHKYVSAKREDEENSIGQKLKVIVWKM